MSIAVDQKALALIRKCEAEGRTVRKIIIDGKRIELEFDAATDVKGKTLDTVKWG